MRYINYKVKSQLHKCFNYNFVIAYNYTTTIVPAHKRTLYKRDNHNF